MRPDQIKFRGKSKKDGKWVYGYFYEECGNTYIIEDRQHNENDLCARNTPHIVNPDTIGQFTGLKTKDGKEIYEGDILTIKEYDNLGILAFSDYELKVFSLHDIMGNLRKEWKGEVEYGNASFYIGDMWLDGLFGDMRCSSPIYEYELIGNIYDNKDLLED